MAAQEIEWRGPFYFTLAEIPASQKIRNSSNRLAGVAKWQTQGT
jgi:hypothetical protein